MRAPRGAIRRSLSSRRVVLEGIELDVDWRLGRGFPLASRIRAAQIPATPGLYAVVNHRSKVVRNGEAENLRARFRSHVSWHRQMRAGTARAIDYRRLEMADPHPYVVAAARYGTADFEFYVVSCDPSLRDKLFRQHVERALFRWVRLRVDLVDGNRQRSWH